MQGSRMSLASDDPEHVIVIPGRHFTPTASAGSAAAVSGDKVEGDLAQEGEVAGGDHHLSDLSVLRRSAAHSRLRQAAANPALTASHPQAGRSLTSTPKSQKAK